MRARHLWSDIEPRPWTRNFHISCHHHPSASSACVSTIGRLYSRSAWHDGERLARCGSRKFCQQSDPAVFPRQQCVLLRRIGLRPMPCRVEPRSGQNAGRGLDQVADETGLFTSPRIVLAKPLVAPMPLPIGMTGLVMLRQLPRTHTHTPVGQET